MPDLNSTYNRIVWVDIPVADLSRAAAFYRSVLKCEVHTQESDESSFCVIASNGGNSGCLILNESQAEGSNGVLIYLNVEGRIRDAITQAELNGGKVIQRIHTIHPHGFRAIVLDSEGNRIALHSTTDA